jgi:hypothetical protein
MTATRPAEPRTSGETRNPVADVRRTTLVRARRVVGLTLIAAAVVWALERGLRFYGLSPVHLAYDLDQPPWLLVLVSGWLWYRSRRR